MKTLAEDCELFLAFAALGAISGWTILKACAAISLACILLAGCASNSRLSDGDPKLSTPLDYDVAVTSSDNDGGIVTEIVR